MFTEDTTGEEWGTHGERLEVVDELAQARLNARQVVFDVVKGRILKHLGRTAEQVQKSTEWVHNEVRTSTEQVQNKYRTSTEQEQNEYRSSTEQEQIKYKMSTKPEQAKHKTSTGEILPN